MEPWKFVYAADIQVGSPRSFRYAPAWNDNWRTAREQIVDENPGLLLVGGDLTRDGSLPAHRYELEGIKSDLDALPFPYRVTPGNMDTGNKHTRVQGAFDNRDDVSLNVSSSQIQQFSDVFGPFYWSFLWKNVRFSSFTTMLLGSGLPEAGEQWRWLEDRANAGPGDADFHVWMTHYPLFIDRPGEANFDIADPAHYHDWYFGIDEPHRSRAIGLLKEAGATHVLSGHVHCYRACKFDGIEYIIGPATSFRQWADRWPDGDASLGFLVFEAGETALTHRLVRLTDESNAKGYGPGGHPKAQDRDYSLAWQQTAGETEA